MKWLITIPNLLEISTSMFIGKTKSYNILSITIKLSFPVYFYDESVVNCNMINGELCS